MATTGHKRKRSKKTVVEKVGSIAIRFARHGCFVIRVRRDGMNHYETFTTIEAARLKAEQLNQERNRHGLSAFDLDKHTRADANEAIKVLNGRSSLVNAVKFWAMHHPDGSATTFRELADLHLADLARRKCRPKTLSDFKHRLGKFCTDHGDRPACTITTADVLQWLEVRGSGPVNQDNFRRALRATFNFARKRGIVTVNPVEAIEATRADHAAPDIWTASQLENALRGAQAFCPGMVPMLAIMAFAGLRPDEAAGLSWENVNLAERSIRVKASTSKTRKDRIIEGMSDNLAEWLAPYHRKAGKVAPAGATVARWRVRLASVLVLGVSEVSRRLAMHKGKKGTEVKALKLGWRDIVVDARAQGATWPQDVLRHSFASHWLPIHHDKARLAYLMGNSPDVIERHYKAVVTTKEAKRYFDIFPATEGRIIALGA